MTVKDKYEALWKSSINTGETDLAKYVSNLFAATGACIIGLAAEIDALRSELEDKGSL
jgi:hypothetical protein